jgi:hypothetical protein
MSQQVALITETSSFAALANWRTSLLVEAFVTTKPSTHKHFAFVANYAAYAERGSWSSIG